MLNFTEAYLKRSRALDLTPISTSLASASKAAPERAEDAGIWQRLTGDGYVAALALLPVPSDTPARMLGVTQAGGIEPNDETKRLIYIAQALARSPWGRVMDSYVVQLVLSKDGQNSGVMLASLATVARLVVAWRDNGASVLSCMVAASEAETANAIVDAALGIGAPRL